MATDVKAAAEAVQEALDILKVIAPGMVGAKFDKHYVASLGKLYKPMYEGVQNEVQAEKKLNTYINNMKKVDPIRALRILESLRLPDNSIAIPGGSRWFNEGLPLIRLTKKHVEEFVGWVPTLDEVNAIKPPFKAFFIELPEKVLFIEDISKKMIPATGIFVHTILLEEERTSQHGNTMKPGLKWRVLIATDTPTVQWQMDRSLLDLTGLVEPENNAWLGIDADGPSEYDMLINRAATHIVCCVCKMMVNTTMPTTSEKVNFPEDEAHDSGEEAYFTVFEPAI